MSLVVMIRRSAMLSVLGACAAVAAVAQDAYVKASVDSAEVTVEQQFWIHIEAQGELIEPPTLPEIDGLWINPKPNTSEQRMISSTMRRHIAKLSYSAIALQPGTITIPAIRLVINGQPMHTEPITLTAVGEPLQTAQTIAQVRAWVEDDVVAGQPFWLHIEASGGDIILPEPISVPGLRIDNTNIRRSHSFAIGRGAYKETRRNSYHCTALEPGEVNVPAFPVQVDRRVVETSTFTLTVSAEPPLHTVKVDPAAPETELTRDDLVFINMEVDKEEVYQGEPLLLKTQLWRILHRYIQSGPVRGSLIIPPSTEGFYVTYLDPVSYVDTHKDWDYEVNEERKVLYPTAIGDLRIGQWHWEGVALAYSGQAARRNRFSYSLNAGPIKVKVKALPPRPAGFSGAVGQFDLEAHFNAQSLSQGVPTKLALTVTGIGNPDAIGDPVVPDLEWAQLSEPERKTNIQVNAQQAYPTVTKQFTYTLVPLRSGIATLPTIEFIYFDPAAGQYASKTAGPFSGVVEAMPGVPEQVIIAAEQQEPLQSVEIISDDIMPIARKVSGLEPHRSHPFLPIAIAIAPVAAFAGVAVVAARRRKFAGDALYARAFHAYRTAMNSLAHFHDAAKPADALHELVKQYVADVYGREAAGLTSSDVRELLESRAVEPDVVEKAAKILRSCERVNYAGHDLSPEEWRALSDGAREFIDGLEALRKP